MTINRTRERLADAAADVFYERGIHQTTVDDAVARAGFSKPTLYKHFRSKDELVEAALALRDRRHRQRLIDLRDQPHRSPRERILAPFEVLESWIRERAGFRGCALVCAAVELPQPEHPGRRVVREHKLWLRQYFERCAAELGASDPDALARALQYLWEGAAITYYLDGDPAAGAQALAAAQVLIEAHVPTL